MTNTDFAQARFAIRPDGKFAARLVTSAHPEIYPWRCSDIHGRSDRAMAEDGFIVVRECPSPEQHDDRYVSRLAVERVQEVQARAEKAERERDEARAGARVAFARCWELKKARQEVVDELYSLRAAEQEPTDAERVVRELHTPREKQVITGDCSIEACDHEDECPTVPFLVCAECWRVADESDTYFEERGVGHVAHPCPTIRALDSARAAQRDKEKR